MRESFRGHRPHRGFLHSLRRRLDKNQSGSIPCTVVMGLIKNFWVIHFRFQRNSLIVLRSNPKTPIRLNQLIIDLYLTKIDRLKTNVWACRVGSVLPPNRTYLTDKVTNWVISLMPQHADQVNETKMEKAKLNTRRKKRITKGNTKPSIIYSIKVVKIQFVAGWHGHQIIGMTRALGARRATIHWTQHLLNNDTMWYVAQPDLANGFAQVADVQRK